jgi:hypothetical protein
MRVDREQTAADPILIKQNDILISLLARSVLGADPIADVVTRGKKDPAAYVKAYNALDGTIGVTEAAKVAGVSQPTMTVVLKSWEEQGIVYNVGEPGRPLYKRLLVLPGPPKQGRPRRRRERR